MYFNGLLDQSNRAEDFNIALIRITISQKLALKKSHKHAPFLSKRAKLGSISDRDMILVLKNKSTRAREFNGWVHLEKS